MHRSLIIFYFLKYQYDLFLFFLKEAMPFKNILKLVFTAINLIIKIKYLKALN